ncbi:hypothetical protein BJ138DRAFT_1221171 [Hygrophoropsis aurantiaca]|uniref:Uncharacterized protein n=1 Tax=Hygrophoropsis aurantiaca TaxID=72124 RepID=A0ACB8AJ50_9AGAM|nr:hypothetical protein BJ138DRAFT_1221171 [Hygrophoropsis aurantiaca]
MAANHSPSSHTEQPHPHSALYRVDLSSTFAQSQYTYPPLPTVIHQHPMDDNSSSASRYHNTSIPSLIPPGIDPASVDFRSFYPYIPNEVKHRKRTTPEQLKSLEEVFAKDTKPNGSLRKTLAQELSMSARGVQVWFQNRRAKEKQHTKKVQFSIGTQNASAQGTQKSSPRDESPNDSSNSSTATEKPTLSVEAAKAASTETSTFNQTSSPKSSPSSKPAPLSACEPIPSPWQNSPIEAPEHPLHARSQPFDLNIKDSDMLSSRRGSLPVLYSHPAAGPDVGQPSTQLERRQSLDASLYRLNHHPFAGIAKERNNIYLPRSPLSSNQPLTSIGRRSPGVIPVRTVSHGPSSYPRPSLMHRASMPHVFAPSRHGTIPESAHSFTHSNSRGFPENPMYAPSRTVPSPIPGPLPSPNFSFGAPQSASPSIASPSAGDYDNAHSPDVAQVSSPDQTQPPSDLAAMQQWTFARGSDDHDTEDSASYSGLSRFGSVTSIAGSESSAFYSDVSSAAAFDPHGRRSSCASGHFLERGMSDLNMNSRSSQGSLNEAHLNAAKALTSRSPLQKTMARQDTGGYCSPSSTASPGGSPHTQDTASSAMQPGDVSYGYNNLARRGSGAFLQSHESSLTDRRLSASIPESIPEIFIQPTMASSSPSFPSPPHDSSDKYQFGAEMRHFPPTGEYTSQSHFAGDGTYSPGDHSFTAELQFNADRHPSLHAVPAPDPIGMHHSISPYAQASTNNYSYPPPPSAKTVNGAQKSFNAYT